MPFVTNENITRIGYVEFRTIELVDKAISLSGTVVMGLPIHIQPTEAETLPYRRLKVGMREMVRADSE